MRGKDDMEKEPNELRNEQSENTDNGALQDMPSFEEHMRKLDGEKPHQEKIAEIEENITELKDSKAVVFIAGRTNGISRIDLFGVECGSKFQSETGEIEDRKMSEQYAIWRLAKDIANSYSREDPRHIRMKALRDFSVVQRLWEGRTLDAQKKDCDDKLIALDKQMAGAVKEQPSELAGKLQWVEDYVHLAEDYNNNLLRRDSIDKIASDIIPYIQEYEQYEQDLDK